MHDKKFKTDECIFYMTENIDRSQKTIMSLYREDEPQSEAGARLIDTIQNDVYKMEAVLYRLNHYKRTIGQ